MNTPSKNDWILEWLAFAKSDRDLALSVLEGEELDIRHAAFHLQQAVEKSLKAALISEGLDPPYTHDLEELIELLPSSWEGDFLNEMVALEDLSAWAAAPRYPGAMPPLSPDLVRQTLEGADALISAVEERITKRLDLDDPDVSLGI